MQRYTKLISLVLLLLAGIASGREVPDYDSPVMDFAGLLEPAEEQALEARILAYRDSTSNEIGVLIIPALDGDNLEDYSNRVFNKWGIGKGNDDNGVLLLIALQERKIRLEVGYGLESALTDLESGLIVGSTSDMATEFRDKNWAAGVNVALDGIIAAIGGDYVPPMPLDDMEPWYIPWLISVGFFALFFGIIALNIRAAYNRAKLAAGGKKVSWSSVIGSGWSSGGHSSSGFSSGSSFGGFSGGSSGGGGASGGW